VIYSKIQEKIVIFKCVLFQYLVEHPHETSDNRHQKMETSLTTHGTSFSTLQISAPNKSHSKCLLNIHYPHKFTDTQSSPLSTPPNSFSYHPPYYPIVIITCIYPFHHRIAPHIPPLPHHPLYLPPLDPFTCLIVSPTLHLHIPPLSFPLDPFTCLIVSPTLHLHIPPLSFPLDPFTCLIVSPTLHLHIPPLSHHPLYHLISTPSHALSYHLHYTSISQHPLLSCIQTPSRTPPPDAPVALSIALDTARVSYSRSVLPSSFCRNMHSPYI
jgi:hypothetical protein